MEWLADFFDTIFYIILTICVTIAVIAINYYSYKGAVEKEKYKNSNKEIDEKGEETIEDRNSN